MTYEVYTVEHNFATGAVSFIVFDTEDPQKRMLHLIPGPTYTLYNIDGKWYVRL